MNIRKFNVHVFYLLVIASIYANQIYNGWVRSETTMAIVVELRNHLAIDQQFAEMCSSAYNNDDPKVVATYKGN